MLDKQKFLESVFWELLNSCNRNQIENIIQQLEGLGAKWRPFGDREMNISTIRISSDPLSSLAERITNAIDATIELYAEKNPTVKNVTSPRIFVEKTFNIPKGSLAELHLPKEKERLTDQLSIELVLKDGDSEETPTIDIIDNGIGVPREEAYRSILGLNSSNKRSKRYLMGIYGQGGSTTLQFSEYVVYVSKSALSDKNEYWFTIVRFNPGGPDVKDGTYEYIVSSEDSLPFCVVPRNQPFKGNTLIRHINYNLSISKQPLLLDIYNGMMMYLFDPVLPFIIREERSKLQLKKNIGDMKRRIYGSRDRLSRTDLIEYKNEQIVSKPQIGRFYVRYWVFKMGTEHKQIQTFVDPYEPIVITYFGQVHQRLQRSILKDKLKLPMLYKYMVIQIDCDEISDVGRRRMFTSTREVMTKEGVRIVQDVLIEALKNDIDRLREMDENRRLQLIESKSSEEEELLRKQLAYLLEALPPGSDEFNIIKRYSRRRLPPLPTNQFPTYIRIANKEPVLQFYISKSKILRLESDAPDGFLTKADKVELKLDDETKQYCNESVRSKDFKGGRLNMTLYTISNKVNTKFKVRIILTYCINNNTIILSDEREAEILLPPQKKKSGQRRGVQAPKIYAVKEGDRFWTERKWNEESVAEVLSTAQGVEIYVSVSNKWLKQAIFQSNYSPERTKLIESRYKLFIAFHAYLQDRRFTKLKNELNLDDRQLDVLKLEEQKNIARIVASMLTKIVQPEKEIEAVG